MRILILGQSGQIAPLCTRCLSLVPNTFISTVSRSPQSLLPSGSHFYVPSYSIHLLAEVLRIVNPDFIIYFLAAGSVRTRPETRDTIKYINYDLPVYLANWCRNADHRTHFIYFSSTAIYKGWKSHHTINLSTQPSPLSYYAYYKTLVHENISEFLVSDGCSFATQIILASVFAGHEHPTRLIPTVISSLINSQSLFFHDSYDRRDYISAYDIASLLTSLLALDRLSPIPTNILAASGTIFSNRCIVNILQRRMKRTLQFQLVPCNPSYYGESFRFDPSGFHDLLGTSPATPEDGFTDKIISDYVRYLERARA